MAVETLCDSAQSLDPYSVAPESHPGARKSCAPESRESLRKFLLPYDLVICAEKRE